MGNRTLAHMLFFIFFLITINSSIAAAENHTSTFFGERNIAPPGLFHGAVWNTGKDDMIQEIRCRVVNFDVFTDDLRVTGLQTVVINTRQKQTEPYSSGRIWGQFVIEPEAYPGSYWTGRLWGEQTADGSWYHKYIGIGTGLLEGLKFRAYSENIDLSTPGPPIPSRTWSIEGFIIEK